MYKKKPKKYLRCSHLDGKREIACFHVETATGKLEKWRQNHGEVSTEGTNTVTCSKTELITRSFSVLRLCVIMIILDYTCITGGKASSYTANTAE